jgi:hypothetical protein
MVPIAWQGEARTHKTAVDAVGSTRRFLFEQKTRQLRPNDSRLGMADQPITFEIRKNPIVYGGGHTFNAQNMTRGVAYVQGGFFVCMYAYATGLRGISPGICFTQKAGGKL